MSKHIINLEDYKTDGSKTGANNPFLSTPNNITHCQLRYEDDSQDEVAYQGVFVLPNTVSFDVDAPLGSLFKLYESSDGVTYTENTAFGGDDGVTLPLESGFLDAADFTDNQTIYKNPNTDLLEPISIADLLTAENIGSGGEALNYYAFNGSIQQKNGVSSSKCVALGTATLNTIADSLAPSLSAKISTGRYELGFATDGVQGFKVYGTDDLNSASFSYLWEKYEQQVYQYDANTSSSIHMGSVLVCANAGNGMFDERGAGSIIIETRNPAGDLADDVLEFGQFISIKRYKQG